MTTKNLRSTAILFAACLCAAFALPAQAQSVFGCTGLNGPHGMPSVEGEAGVFYRVNPDLHMFHAFSEETAADLGALSQALASLGTTLVYVPVPTKSLSMPDQLPPEARDLGFEVSLASTIHGEMLDKLRKNNVQTADIRSALRGPAGEPPSVFPTDYRLTAAGARRAAMAIAATLTGVPGFADLPKGQFETRPAGVATLESDMRSILQQHCLITLPPAETETFTTTRMQQGSTASGNTIFGSRTGGARVAVVGTEHTGETVANFAGFLAEFTGLEVVQYSVSGGGAFAAISSYLTSREFQEARPAFLVWTNPIEFNLAQFGDQPLRELVAASGDTCRFSLPLVPGNEANIVTADLRGLDMTQSPTLFLEAEGVPAASARFDFLSESGLVRSKSVYRHPDQVKTGRFYMPMSGLWPEGAQLVDIVLDVPFGAATRVTACYN